MKLETCEADVMREVQEMEGKQLALRSFAQSLGPREPRLSLYSLLSICYSGKVCLIGVGNRMKGDDGAGSLLIERISGRINADCVDAGVAPENILEKVVRLKPETVLIIDAVDFDGTPGEIRIFDPEQISRGGISTHTLSLQMVCDYLKARIPACIFILGIQPKSVGFSDELSRDVACSIDSLERTFLDLSFKA